MTGAWTAAKAKTSTQALRRGGRSFERLDQAVGSSICDQRALRIHHSTPPGRNEHHGYRPEIAHRQFWRLRFGEQEIIRFQRDMMIGVVPDPEGRVAGEIV